VLAQGRETRKNYIELLSDEIDERRAVESLDKSRHLMKNYLRDLVAAVLGRHSDAR
jgi:hypothetical protein